jgi:para-nitrobenzyl esterase
MKAAMGDAAPGLAGGVVRGNAATKTPPASGAVHSAEIEYALGNLHGNEVFDWTPDDHKVSAVMQEYFANFIKTGDPNGKSLPKWPPVTKDAADVMIIDVNTRAEKEKSRARYLFLDQAATDFR